MKRWTVVAAVLALALVGMPASMAADQKTDEGATWHWFGSLRARPEYNDNLTDFFAGRDDKIGYTSYRANLGAMVDLDKGVSVVLNAQALGKWGEDRTPIRGTQTESNLSSDIGFFEAYVDVKNLFGQPFSLRAGRQKMVLGDGWLMGDLDFYGGTSWDGIRGDLELKHGTITPFWAKIAETKIPEALRNLDVSDFEGKWEMYGLWTNWKFAGKQSLDAAILFNFDHRHFPEIPAPAFAWRDKRFTYTARYAWGGESGPYVNVNAALQGGRTLSEDATRFVDVKADAEEATGGYVWIREGNPYRVWARIARYTGDKPGTVRTDETFRPIAMDFHGRYGLTDSWNGLWRDTAYIGGAPGFEVLMIGFDVTIPRGVRLQVFAQTMRRNQKVSPDVENRNLGQEFGVSASYDYGKNLSMELGFSQVYPGTAIGAEAPLFSQTTAKRLYVNTVVHF